MVSKPTSAKPQRQWSRPHWIIVALTALCTLLLTLWIERPSYWIDEKISVDIASANTPQQVVANVVQGERRPPAYHLGLWAWMRLMGDTERMARLYSVAWITLLVPATFQLTRRLGNEPSAMLAAALAASSPVVVSYGQTVRYYGMVATLSALSYALFLDVTRRKRKPWAPYALVTLALLYCDYPAYGVVAAQNILAIIWWHKRSETPHHPRWTWLAVQAALAVIAALWIPVVLTQGTRNLGAAGLSYSIVGTLFKVTYPFYAWTIGETLFPWSPFALVSVLIGGALLVYGFIRLKHPAARTTWLVAFALPFVISQVLLETVATDSPFVNAPARSMACIALLYALLGVGLASLRSRQIQTAALLGLTVAHGLALANYYRGVDFINSVYNTPARDVAKAIAAQAKPGDVVITEGDNLVEYYLPAVLRASHFYPQQRAEIQAHLAAHQQATIWQVIMGRDRTRNDISSNLSDWLKTRYTLHASIGFAEQDATYRKLKSRLLEYEAYRYRLMLNEYQP